MSYTDGMSKGVALFADNDVRGVIFVVLPAVG